MGFVFGTNARFYQHEAFFQPPATGRPQAEIVLEVGFSFAVVNCRSFLPVAWPGGLTDFPTNRSILMAVNNEHRRVLRVREQER